MRGFQKLYQLWVSGEGTMQAGPQFKLLADAMRYIEEHADRSFAIRTPDGGWYRDEGGRSIFGRGVDGEPAPVETRAVGTVPMNVSLSDSDPPEVLSMRRVDPADDLD